MHRLFSIAVLAAAIVFCAGCPDGEGADTTAPSVTATTPAAGEGADTAAPSVIATTPRNGAQDVDPSLTELTVTFSKEMQDGSWSWARERTDQFPQTTGQAYYKENGKVNALPVRLDPDKEYVIWINSEQFQGFKDKAGNPAVPFRFTFKTRGAGN